MGHGDRDGSRTPPGDPKKQKLVGDALALPVPGSMDVDSELRFPPKGAGAQSSVTEFEKQFESMWSTRSPALIEEISKPINDMVKKTTKEVLSGMVAKVDNIEKGFNQMSSQVNKVEANMSSLESKMGNLSLQMEQLLSRNASGSSDANGSDVNRNVNGSSFVGSPPSQVSQNVSSPDGFFREINRTILFCNVTEQTKVSRDKFHKSIVELMSEANINEDCFDLIGDALDDRFEIKFTKQFETAKSQCSQFLDSLRLGRGKWKKQAVPDCENVETQFYIQPDKNPAQVKREIATKLLRDVVQSLVPDTKEVWAKRATGTLFVDKRRLLSVRIQGEDVGSIDWSHPKRIALGLDQAPVELALKNFLLGEGPSFS